MSQKLPSLDLRLSPSAYRQAAQKHRIPVKDELPLIMAWREQADREARDRLMNGTAWVAANNAHAVCLRTPDLRSHFSDMVADSQLIMLEKVEEHDPQHGAAFSTWMNHRIKNYLKRYYLKTLPVSYPDDSKIDPEKIYHGVELDTVQTQETLTPENFNNPAAKRHRGSIPDALISTDCPVENAARREVADRFSSFINRLPPRQQDIACSLWTGNESAHAIGERFNLSDSRVYQIADATLKAGVREIQICPTRALRLAQPLPEREQPNKSRQDKPVWERLTTYRFG